MERTFKIYFNDRKQWLDVYLYDVHPITFKSWGGGRWAYFIPKWEKNRRGFFGELHFVKSGIREDTIAHEMFHVICEWLFSRQVELSPRNEERTAELLDELVRNFYREHRKLDLDTT